jgi:hypothetical protein
MSFKSSGVNLKGQFHLKNTDPIDSRYIITSKDEYDTLISKDSNDYKFLYPGLTFAVIVSTAFTGADNKTINTGIYQVGTGYSIDKQIQIGSRTLSENQLVKILDFMDLVELDEE